MYHSTSIVNNILCQFDSEVANLIESEDRRQAKSLSLIASESLAFLPSLLVHSSCLANKLIEGYPKARYSSGCEVIDRIESLAIKRACTLFKAEYANVQTYSGTFANVAVFLALLNIGNRILAMNPNDGGHHSHGEYPHINHLLYDISYYGVDPDNGRLNYDVIRKQAIAVRPKLIIAVSSFYPRTLNFQEFANISSEVGAYLMADIAHICGLVAADIHPSPVPWCDIVTSSTYKTLLGPRGGGLILCRKKFDKAIDMAVWPGLQGAPVADIIASRAVLYKYAGTNEFYQLQKDIIRNAQAFAESLSRYGMSIHTRGTDNHLIIAKLGGFKISAKEAEKRLEKIGITCNKIPIPGSQSHEIGLRFGSVIATQRGFGIEEMDFVAKVIVSILMGDSDKISLMKNHDLVLDLLTQYPIHWRTITKKQIDADQY